MNVERFARVMRLFEQACELDEAARRRFLDEACGDDRDLRREIDDMLAADRSTDGAVDHLTAGGGIQLLANQAALEGLSTPDTDRLPTEQIGRYRLRRKVGQGGMGVVYEAEQDRPRRRVALKLMQHGLVSPRLARRFEFEAEALGRLQHPGIAQIHDAGTWRDPTGIDHPFIAMEFVDGVPIDEYARRVSLDTRGRLALIAEVCDAIQHAHNNGVIHRDLKPGNVLVCEEGSKPRPEEWAARREAGADEPLQDDGATAAASADSVTPVAVASLHRRTAAQIKVLDFGVARPVADNAHSLTGGTMTGQLVGTLPYMSPEQVGGDPEAIDTRSDVYSIGVVLYQLLTGTLPHDLRSRSLPEAARMIREDAPLRLSSADRTLRGEVETIVAKALEKDASRRYQSAAELGADLRRYLAGEPIEAKRDSALYVLRKQLRRYRGAVAAALLFVAVLIGFSITAAFQARANRRMAMQESAARHAADEARDRAEIERRRADESADKLRDQVNVANNERGRLLSRTGNLPDAEPLLWPPFIRNPNSPSAYWALWEAYLHQPCRRAWRAHETPVSGLACSPDERTLATAGDVAAIKLWDAETLKVVRNLEGHAGRIWRVEFSPDGRLLASASEDETAIIWDCQSGRKLKTLRGHKGSVRAATFSPDGRRLATAGADATAIVWDVQTGVRLETLRSHTAQIWQVVFSPEGRRIATCADDMTVRVWDASTYQPESTLRGHTDPVYVLAFGLGGTVLASGGADRTIRVWDVEARTCLAVIPTRTGTVRYLAFADDGRTIVSAGWWTLDICDAVEGRMVQSFYLHDGAASLAVRANSRGILVGGSGGGIREWEVGARRGFRRIGGLDGRSSAAWSPDGQLIAGGDGRGVIRVLDADSGAVRCEWRGHAGRCRSLRFQPHGTLLATGGADGRMRLWDPASGTLLSEFDGHNDVTPDSLAFSPDGTLLASSCGDQTVSVRRVVDGYEFARLRGPGNEVLAVRFMPDGREVIATVRGEPIWCWSLSGEARTSQRLEATAWVATVDSSGQMLAVSGWDRAIRLLRMGDFAKAGVLVGHGALPNACEFHPSDSRLLASASSDGTIRFWSVVEGRGVLTLDDFSETECLSVGFSPDGERLLAANSRGEIGIWDLAYYARHIAGNLEAALARFASPSDDRQVTALRAWAAGVPGR